MAKTGAERQAEYRARQSVQESGQRRISTWISTDAALALEALADRYGVTMRDVIEMLLLRDHESPDNPPINNNFVAMTRSRKKRPLPSNEPFHIASIGNLPVEELLRNATEALPRNRGKASLRTDKERLLRNEAGPERPAETSAAPERANGEQYSLEL
jgi:hypothetical protein